MVVLTENQILAKARGNRPNASVTNLGTVKNLNLWGQNLSDVSILKNLPNLEVVSLALNSLTSLSAFSNLPNLRELYLRRNQIADIREISHLQSLQSLKILWLSENPVAEQDPVAYRRAVVKAVPWLEVLDDRAVTGAEREEARRGVAGIGGTGGSEGMGVGWGFGGDVGGGYSSNKNDKRSSLPPISEHHSASTSGTNKPSRESDFPVHAVSPVPSMSSSFFPAGMGQERDLAAPHRPILEDHLSGPGLELVAVPHQMMTDARRRRPLKRWNRDGSSVAGDDGRSQYSDTEPDLLQTAFHVPSASASPLPHHNQSHSFPSTHASDVLYNSQNQQTHAAYRSSGTGPSAPSQGAGLQIQGTRQEREAGRMSGMVSPVQPPQGGEGRDAPGTPTGRRNRPSWLGSDDQKQKREIKQRIRAASTSSDSIGGPAFLNDRGNRNSQISEEAQASSSSRPAGSVSAIPPRDHQAQPQSERVGVASHARGQGEELVKPKS
ncbi:hypothetical protein HK097_003646, partial [Rhizophlyctis rosea]